MFRQPLAAFSTLALFAILLTAGAMAMPLSSINGGPTLFLPLVSTSPPPPTVGVYATDVGDGSTVTAIRHAGDDRLFVTTQEGNIWVVDQDSSGAFGTALPGRFLDLRSQVSVSFEEGLLGLAFHPDYASNRTFFVTYTRIEDGAMVLARYQTRVDNPNRADTSSRQVVMTIAKPLYDGSPARVHNAGDIHFSPADGYLYFALGDGGPDPYQLPNRPADIFDNGQEMDRFWGKILRLDVDQRPGSLPPSAACFAPGSAYGGYGVPADNPWTGDATVPCNEIWSTGWRNPWRFSFDRVTGDMWIGDVGEERYEEINYEPLGAGGRNYGWKCFEGIYLHVGGDCLIAGELSMPVQVWPREVGSSAIGGFVYRGEAMPRLQGIYLYSDFRDNTILAVPSENPTSTAIELISSDGEPWPQWTTFGEDRHGEVYLSGLGSRTIYKIVPRSNP